MAGTDSYYSVLGLSTDVSQEAIETAYRQLIQRLQNKIARGEAPDPAFFDTLTEAFTTLRDPEKRKTYDASQGIVSYTEAVTTPPLQKESDSTAPTSSGAVTNNEPQELRFSFMGSGGEYFRIWIVNLMLSIVTLGIYSAWAKVRREQYFHRNTVLDGSGFDYHAKPQAILKGRMLAGLFFVIISAAENFGTLIHVLALIAGACVAPWVLVRAFRFRAYNTSYRGLRMSFSGDYRGVAAAYIGYGLLALITFGITTPLWIRATRLYMLNHLHYGHGAFTCDAPTRPFFVITMKPLLLFALAGVIAGVLSVAISGWVFSLFGIGIFFGYLLYFPYVQMSLTNLIWNHAHLDGNAFFSDMELKPYVLLVLKNWLFILLTLGFYWPYAKINLAAYRAEHTGLSTVGGLGGFIAAAHEHVSALGDEAADMFDMDIAL